MGEISGKSKLVAGRRGLTYGACFGHQSALQRIAGLAENLIHDSRLGQAMACANMELISVDEMKQVMCDVEVLCNARLIRYDGSPARTNLCSRDCARIQERSGDRIPLVELANYFVVFQPAGSVFSTKTRVNR